MTRRRAVVLSVLLAIGVGGAVAASERSRTDATYAAVAFYSEAMSIVHEHYVDQLPWATLVDNGIAGMVEALDADSDVLSPSQSRDSAPATPGQDGDVGIVLGRRNGTLAVIATRDGTSARAAGLLSGDAVLQVDGVSAEHLPPAGARARLRGQPGSQVVISIGRQGWAEPKSITLTRARTTAEDVSDRMLGDGILYVRIPEFRDTTAQELERLLAAAPADHATGLVLDLRDTSGGKIEAAVAVAGMFLDTGQVVARVQSRRPSQAAELPAPAPSAHHDQPIAVLVNRGTESSAEVLAGALQDWGRAIIAGSPTFGDASAQSATSLPGEQTLLLTTARYLTPKGHPISGKGIAPDVPTPAHATAALEPNVAPINSANRDAEVRLAFDLVKAARIFQHERTGADASAHARTDGPE